MLKLHFISALRSLKKNRNVALINITGLTIGLTAFLFMIHYLFYEVSFDTFYPQYHSIYRINMDVSNGSERFYHGAKTSRGLYFSCKNDVPGIEANGVAYFESCLIRNKETGMARQRVLWVDEGFEKVFPFNMTEGDVDFTRPLTGIIARSKVKGLFGEEDPVGKIMEVNEGMPVEITGIFNDLPSNTHFTADYFISLKTWVSYGWISRGADWNFNGYWNYVKLAPGASAASLENTLSDLVNANSRRGINERTATIFFQPLSDLHYLRGLEGEMGSQTNERSLFFLLTIAVLTIIIAWINYISLSTALAAKRADEIGMRKLIGASVFHIWIQSVFETVILYLVSVSLSFILYSSLLHVFANYFRIPLALAVFPRSYILWSLAGISFAGIIIASVHNTLTLSGLHTFKGQKASGTRRSFRTVMVITQMSLSVIFICITLVVYKQIIFMKNSNTGIDFKPVITINAPASLNSDSTKRTRFLGFRDDLLQHLEFTSATAIMFTPGEAPRYGYTQYYRPEAGIHPNSLFFENNGDNGLIETFGLKLVAGKNFSPAPRLNRRKVLVNEKSVKELGFGTNEEAVGKMIHHVGRDSLPVEIIGVLADFHNEGLQKPIYPMIFNNSHPFEFGYYSVKLNATDVTKAINDLKTVWAAHYSSDPMDYFFADEYFFRQYQSEDRFGKFYSLLTGLSITIACLGLYGLIVFYLEQKRKEIGIRKINGAKVTEVMTLLGRDFLVWILIAYIIAFPVAWLFMNKWLQSYAYRTALSWWVFGLSGFAVLVIAIFTISFQSWKAATKNPVEALRYE